MENQESHKYDDIINLPHHVSLTRPQMSMIERAAQFSPFQALTGYGAAVDEAGRRTEEKIELADNQKEALDERLQLLRESITEHPSVTVTFFKPDLLKDGGSYETASGPVKKIDQIKRTLVMSDGLIIPIEDIFAVEGEVFRFMDGM